MRIIPYMFNEKKTVYAYCADNETDNEQLVVLAAQTRFICSISVVTGLRIVEEFMVNGRRVVLASLKETIVLNVQESVDVQAYIRRAL